MTFDLYIWESPRDLDADAAEALVARWQDAGGDPAASPFEASTNIGWFHRELIDEIPDLQISTDAVRSGSRLPVWMSPDNKAAARVIGVRVPAGRASDVAEFLFSLAVKYDLVVFDRSSHRLVRPMEVMAAHASATFWPGGAIQAAVAGVGGGAVAMIAWLLAIPIVSGVVAVAGGFMFVMAVFTFAHEGRKRISRG